MLDGFPDGATFHPLGIDVIANPADRDYRLFVVNHGKDNNTIEIFSLPDPTLLAMSITPKATYLKTLTHRKFVSPNGIHALSPTSFYVTNDHTSTRRIKPPMLGAVLAVSETFFKYHNGWVDLVRFSDEDPQAGVTIKKAALRVPFANGISVSPDGRTVAVVSSNDLQVLLYNRDQATDSLSYATSVPIPFYPDNVSFDSAGSLLLAGHPSFKSLIKLARNPAETVTGSWIVEITKAKLPQAWRGENATGPFTDLEAPFPTHVRAPIVRSHLLKTLYQSDGSGYSTSSSAVLDRDFGKLFAVGLYGQGMLQCNMETHYGELSAMSGTCGLIVIMITMFACRYPTLLRLDRSPELFLKPVSTICGAAAPGCGQTWRSRRAGPDAVGKVTKRGKPCAFVNSVNFPKSVSS